MSTPESTEPNVAIELARMNARLEGMDAKLGDVHTAVYSPEDPGKGIASQLAVLKSQASQVPVIKTEVAVLQDRMRSVHWWGRTAAGAALGAIVAAVGSLLKR